jgi:hypothetical protein
VIAGDPEYVHASVAKLGERSQRAKALPRYYGLPLEPEVEQVAVYHERLCISFESTEERHERSLDLRARDSQVGVAYDIAWRVQHGSEVSVYENWLIGWLQKVNKL